MVDLLLIIIYSFIEDEYKETQKFFRLFNAN